MTCGKLPASVAYSFGLHGEAKRWGSRSAVILGTVAIFIGIFGSVLYAALASPADVETIGAALSGRNRIPTFQYWSVGIVLIVSAYALNNFIS